MRLPIIISTLGWAQDLAFSITRLATGIMIQIVPVLLKARKRLWLDWSEC